MTPPSCTCSMSQKKYSLAVLGTGSDVGKSILAAGICRILAHHYASAENALTVAPFKAQNMSNNAYPALITTTTETISSSGRTLYGEIGIAQAIQARACYQVPRVEMNPILLKSGGRRASDGAYLCSVFVLGRHVTTVDYGTLGQRTETLMEMVLEAYQRLSADIVILEGAGSCTELNLQHRDVVNLPLVRRIQSPWILVANIDPGGVFAQVVGTKACVSPADWNMCAGVVINKLRGDVQYFEPGPQILQDMVGKPIFVVPWLYDLNIAEEDSMGLERRLAKEHLIEETEPTTTARNLNSCNNDGSGNNDNHNNTTQKARIVVVCYPHVSMTDDILPLEQDDRFQVEWRRHHLPIHDPMAIILPGSRQTRVDMEWLATQSPWYEYLISFAHRGGKILGLCGGYQMLGQHIADPQGIESSSASDEQPGWTQGLGLLTISTTLEANKVVQEVRQAVLVRQPSITVDGFEIHCGQSAVANEHCESVGSPFIRMSDGSFDGWEHRNIAGTYLHGILASSAFRSWYFDVGEKKSSNDSEESSDPLDRLARHLIKHGLTVNVLQEIMGMPNPS